MREVHPGGDPPRGLQVELQGRGIARAQMPPPGRRFAQGERIRVQFGPLNVNSGSSAGSAVTRRASARSLRIRAMRPRWRAWRTIRAKLRPGFLFFAFPGAHADGRVFAAQAWQNGALAVVSELPSPEGFAGPGSRWSTGGERSRLAARNFYGAPGRTIGTYRDHRNQRQDDDVLPDRFDSACGGRRQR